MSRTISIEQLDGMIAEQERAREAIRLKVVAMQELKTLFFGNDASGGGAAFGAGESDRVADQADGTPSGPQGDAATEHLRRVQADLAAEQDDPKARVPALWK